MLSQHGHASLLFTLLLEALTKKAPNVTFIHDFPSPVQTNLARSRQGAAILVLNVVFKIIGPVICILVQECGRRHLFFVMNAQYPARTCGDADAGMPVAGGVAVARGTSRVYSSDWNGESTGPKVEELLTKFRKEGRAGGEGVERYGGGV